MTDPDLALLIDAARAAGDIARHYFQRGPQVQEKPDGQGPVTEADLHVNRQLFADLTGARSDYGWLSEETEDTPERLNTDRQFIIDPIDGTRAFIDGTKDWSHSLAISQGGVITAGVVYLPMRDALFAASLRGGATLNGVPIKVSGARAIDGANVLAAKPNLDLHHWHDPMPLLNRHFRPSLAYRMALVAQGRFDAMLTLRPTWEWDVAAGALIITEAGGTVTDQSGLPAVFNNPYPQIGGVVAGGGVHDQIMRALR